ERTQSFRDLHNEITRYVRDRQSWYAKRIPQKRLLAKSIRYSSVFLAGAGTILELFAISGTGSVMTHHAAAVFVVVATLVGLDRLTAASSGWVRYHLTKQALDHNYRQFQLAWLQEYVRLSQAPDPFDPVTGLDFFMSWQAKFAGIVDV